MLANAGFGAHAELRESPGINQVQQVRVMLPGEVRARSGLRAARRTVDRAGPHLDDTAALVMSAPGAMRVRPRADPAPRQAPDVCGEDSPALPLVPAERGRDGQARGRLDDHLGRERLAATGSQEPPGLQGGERIT